MNDEKVIKRRVRKPSAKMIKFGCLLATGEHTIVEAYRLSYDASKMSDAVARNESSKLANRRDITMIVEEEKSRLLSLQADKESQKRMADAVQHTSDRERVLTRLRTWLDLPPDSALQLRAAEILAKAVGLNNQVIVSESKDSTSLAAELEAMLLAANEATQSVANESAESVTNDNEQLH
tara:strand:- start:4556 stop:5095 length:540 start_codon:yes stop_codon:yes gene_type:complete